MADTEGWKSVRGRKVPWGRDDAQRVANAWLGLLSPAAISSLQGGVREVVRLRGASATKPKAKDVEDNYVWERGILEHGCCAEAVPSFYFAADCFLELHKLLDSKVFRGVNGKPASNEELKRAALKEGTKCKMLFSALRFLYRASKGSKSTKIETLKGFLRKRGECEGEAGEGASEQDLRKMWESCGLPMEAFENLAVANEVSMSSDADWAARMAEKELDQRLGVHSEDSFDVNFDANLSEMECREEEDDPEAEDPETDPEPEGEEEEEEEAAKEEDAPDKKDGELCKEEGGAPASVATPSFVEKVERALQDQPPKPIPREELPKPKAKGKAKGKSQAGAGKASFKKAAGKRAAASGSADAATPPKKPKKGGATEELPVPENMPAEVRPGGSRGKLSYTAVGPSGAKVEVLLKRRCFNVKGVRSGCDMPKKLLFFWTDDPATAWEELRSAIDW